MKRATFALALALALAPHAVGADPESRSLPFELDARPFLLVDAPRRFAPGEPAFVRVQKAHGGPVQVGVFRVRALASFVAEAADRQGVSIAAGAVGAASPATCTYLDPNNLALNATLPVVTPDTLSPTPKPTGAVMP